MARPARFERATAWFVARYSIQLSYGRLAQPRWVERGILALTLAFVNAEMRENAV